MKMKLHLSGYQEAESGQAGYSSPRKLHHSFSLMVPLCPHVIAFCLWFEVELVTWMVQVHCHFRSQHQGVPGFASGKEAIPAPLKYMKWLVHMSCHENIISASWRDYRDVIEIKWKI